MLSCVDGHLGFYFLATVSRAAKNMGAQHAELISWVDVFSSPRLRLLGFKPPQILIDSVRVQNQISCIQYKVQFNPSTQVDI